MESHRSLTWQLELETASEDDYVRHRDILGIECVLRAAIRRWERQISPLPSTDSPSPRAAVGPTP